MSDGMFKPFLRLLIIGPFVLLVFVLATISALIIFAVEWLLSWEATKDNTSHNVTTLAEIYHDGVRFIWDGKS